jgi:hypothetical protein
LHTRLVFISLQQITFKFLSEIKNTTAHALGENLWHRDSSFKMHRPGIETATRKQAYAAKEEIDLMNWRTRLRLRTSSFWISFRIQSAFNKPIATAVSIKKRKEVKARWKEIIRPPKLADSRLIYNHEDNETTTERFSQVLGFVQRFLKCSTLKFHRFSCECQEA